MGNDALFHHAFDYPVKTEGEALEHIGTYAGHLPFMGESHLRPDGYGLLDQQLLQSVPMSTPKYSRFSGNFEIPVLILLPLPSPDHLLDKWLEFHLTILSGNLSRLFTISELSSAVLPIRVRQQGTNYFNVRSLLACMCFHSSLLLRAWQSRRLMLSNENRPSSSGMPPPTPSPGNHSSGSPSTSKGYADPASHIPRYGYDSHALSGFATNASLSSVLSGPRSISSSYNTMSSSASHSAYGPSNASQGAEASTHFPTLTSQNSVPPFQPTRMFAHTVVAANGTALQVDIQTKIDKGFFKADQDWTCYRRNYFSVACSYTLKPYSHKLEPLSLRKSPRESNPPTIRSFAICISARVDSEEGKLIDLVQHTPKRDKGPTGRPEKIKLQPHTSSSYNIRSEHGGGLNTRSELSTEYETAYAPTSPNTQQSQTIANFDRIQFKNATANNGKRRAAQQYFHIVVELFAEVPSSQSTEPSWVKVASRISAPMVVRGRSPGHYSDDRRGSSTSMGPGGGSTGESSGSQQDPHSGSSGVGQSGVAGMFNNPPRLGGGGGTSNQKGHHMSGDYIQADSLSDRSSTSSDYEEAEMPDYERPKETILTPEEEDNIVNHEGYQYYPSTLLAAPAISNVPRPVLPADPNSTLQSNSTELASQQDLWYSGSVPAQNNFPAGFGRSTESSVSAPSYHASHIGSSAGSIPANNGIASRSCGRFHGVDTSRGHYPETPAW
ncbi:MAG: hypothetical protein Q9225_004923 [Loekoesia sp. 1 TL-2023]